MTQLYYSVKMKAYRLPRRLKAVNKIAHADIKVTFKETKHKNGVFLSPKIRISNATY